MKALAEAHPGLLQVAYYEGHLRSWHAVDGHDPGDPASWNSRHEEFPEDIEDPALSAALVELKAVLSVANTPYFWHRCPKGPLPTPPPTLAEELDELQRKYETALQELQQLSARVRETRGSS